MKRYNIFKTVQLVLFIVLAVRVFFLEGAFAGKNEMNEIMRPHTWAIVMTGMGMRLTKGGNGQGGVLSRKDNLFCIFHMYSSIRWLTS